MKITKHGFLPREIFKMAKFENLPIEAFARQDHEI